ncbi:NtaA/DmoA family FMN-dependent monooxygenase [Pseudoclavibacter sp. 8L]|uniref:NtaA/DmoA family FMN-dependent monooxygenase n=1 Tax=Pseudoclavibacter sp. 8L TaxID=2653162 RepID=UPI0012F04990|nr:NtaA/DmoA family FMN-dependent monooxygenase [Pseudoclavibacter sp. 8L]VXB14880.1 putative monooxygenase YxeK [Pseudoclavibacter sp. 8L]
MSGTPLKQVHLAAHFPGVNNTTIWTDPDAGSQIDLASFRAFAETAERGRFDYLFLAEGLRLREHKGRIHELDVVGRPNTLVILAALASLTEHIGLVGTLSSTFNEPADLARQLATLDHLSEGRAGWNVVTSSDAFHGQNFRRGGFLEYAERYERAEEFVRLSKRLWDAWEADAIAANPGRGEYLRPGGVSRINHVGKHFDVETIPNLPRSPQRYPVIVQAGDSPAGRDFASANAEIIFSLHAAFEDGKRFYDDVKGRLPAAGRSRDSLLIMPAATFVIGDSEADARERSREEALAQVSPQTAIAMLEQVWGRDLSGVDPDGPLPDLEPGDERIRAGQANDLSKQRAQISKFREIAERESLTVRELMVKLNTRHTFVGTASHIADEISRYVQGGASDGFVIVPSLIPNGLDRFVDGVIPELQERGVYREEYTPGATLRETLGLPAEPPSADAPSGQLLGAGGASAGVGGA